MGIMQLWGGHDTDEDEDMARANARPLDKVKVDAHVQQLKLAVRDPDAFKRLLTAIDADKTLSAAEVAAIAQGFVGGVKPKSKKAAITAIGQERLRLSHAKAKGESAAKTRTW
jgi:hypothetical protein